MYVVKHSKILYSVHIALMRFVWISAQRLLPFVQLKWEVFVARYVLSKIKQIGFVLNGLNKAS